MTDEETQAERRQHTRVNFRADARLFSDGVSRPCELLNVSVKGALLTRPSGWSGDAGDRCLLEITLEGGAPVEMEINIVRAESDKIAVDWDMFDVAGFVQLRDMLEQQLGDPALVAEEMAYIDEVPDA